MQTYIAAYLTSTCNGLEDREVSIKARNETEAREKFAARFPGAHLTLIERA